LVTGQHGEAFGARLRNRHSVERVAMPLRQPNQRLAMVGQHRKQIEAVWNRQEAIIPGDAVERLKIAIR
jgi:hypothetical protein